MQWHQDILKVATQSSRNTQLKSACTCYFSVVYSTDSWIQHIPSGELKENGDRIFLVLICLLSVRLW